MTTGLGAVATGAGVAAGAVAGLGAGAVVLAAGFTVPGAGAAAWGAGSAVVAAVPTTGGGRVRVTTVAVVVAVGSVTTPTCAGSTVDAVVDCGGGLAVVTTGRLAEAMTEVRPNTPDAVSPVAMIRAPAAT